MSANYHTIESTCLLGVWKKVKRVKVKVCGLTRHEDAVHAAEAGADYLGVILVPSSPRFRSQAQAQEILDGLAVPSVLVVADQDPAETISTAELVGASVVQLHGNESPEFAGGLRTAGPWEVWKALQVRETGQLEETLSRYAAYVDGFLLDAWHPKKMGGTGRVFSWGAVAEIRSSFPEGLKFVVAGGLNSGNVEEATRILRPDVVDVSSGVEEGPGLKDRGLVEAFIQSVRGTGMGENG
jgi:phosphoribosylanthranilate isomerase